MPRLRTTREAEAEQLAAARRLIGEFAGRRFEVWSASVKLWDGGLVRSVETSRAGLALTIAEPAVVALGVSPGRGLDQLMHCYAKAAGSGSKAGALAVDLGEQLPADGRRGSRASVSASFRSRGFLLPFLFAAAPDRPGQLTRGSRRGDGTGEGAGPRKPRLRPVSTMRQRLQRFLSACLLNPHMPIFLRLFSPTGTSALDQAQQDKLEMICRKLPS